MLIISTSALVTDFYIYWRTVQRLPPYCLQLLFAISASSAQSERDLSYVGRTVTDARSQLSASNVESIEILIWGL